MKSISRSRWSLLIALFVLVAGFGYLLAIQFEPTFNKAYVVPAQNVELVDIMKELQSENDRTAQRITDLQTQMTNLEHKGASTNSEIRDLTQRLTTLRSAAGLTKVSGPGVVVTLSDSTQTRSLSDDSSYYIIHDGYLRNVVNLMRRYGATAISINDQRILSDSSIVCAGPIILVNSSKMSPPYVITALGNPDMLASSISQDVFFKILEAYRDQFGITCSLEKKTSVTVPASLNASAYKYAKGER